MVKRFIDGGHPDLVGPLECDGFTSNPSLMKNGGYTDYWEYAELLVAEAKSRPVSLEVLADDLPTMDKQARQITKLGENVYVKIPVMTSDGSSTGLLIHLLAQEGIKLNITAVFTLEQIRTVARQLSPVTPAIISIFAGRIADTQIDPTPMFTSARHVAHAKTEILWASAREVYNVRQAELAGADIITLSVDLFKKLSLKGKDLNQFSRETVQEFYEAGKCLHL